MFQLGARQDLRNHVHENLLNRALDLQGITHSQRSFFLLERVCLSSSDLISSMPMGFVLTAANLQIAVHNTVVSTQFLPRHPCELVQKHACLNTAPIHDHATLILCMSHLDVRTCE